MGITTEQYEKIIRFLDAEMGLAEMDAFEKELAANPEMRQQLDFEQSLRDIFASQNITSLPGTVPANERAAPRKIPGKITGVQKWLAIGSAAAVIIALVLFTALWKKPEPASGIANRKDIDTTRAKSDQPQIVTTTPEKDSSEVIDLVSLFKKYFKKDALPDEYPVFLAEALMDYEQGNYATLQKLNLNDLPQTRGTNETDSKENILQLGHYYKGLAFLQTNNARDAIINLDWVLTNHPDKALKDKAQWYLALSYLKSGQRVSAANELKKVKNVPYSIPAKKLLIALNPPN